LESIARQEKSFLAEGLLRSLAVSNEYRGQKLGSTLTQAIEACAHVHGVERLYLLTTIADQFFRRHGYKVVSRDSAPASVCETTEGKSVCPASAVFITKALAY